MDTTANTDRSKFNDIQNTILVYSCIIITMFCWSFSYIATKVALQTFSVNALIFSRFFLASLFFLILLIIKGFPRFTRIDHIKIIFTSIAFPFAYYYLETMALNFTTATEASLLSAVIPIVVLILSGIFLKERITLIAASGVVFSFIGIVVLIFGNPEQKFELNGNFLGNTLMLGSVFSFSVYMILTRSLKGKYTAFEITSIQTIYGTILFFIFCVCLNPKKFSIQELGLENIAAVLFLSIFATVIAFLCYNYALAKISATKASLFINSVPVITSILAWSMLHEQLTKIQLIGGLIVVVAVTVTCTYKKQPIKE